MITVRSLDLVSERLRRSCWSVLKFKRREAVVEDEHLGLLDDRACESPAGWRWPPETLVAALVDLSPELSGHLRYESLCLGYFQGLPESSSVAFSSP